VKILHYSPAFLPQVGGLELNVANIAEHLQWAGHEVTVVTRTLSSEPDHFPFRVVRCPSARELLRWTRWCDLFFQANVSLRGLWPLLLVRRPWAVSHHSWYCRTDGRIAWQDRLKRFLLRYAAASIAVSQAVADDLATPSVVIPNPYRDHLFRLIPGIERTKELLFVGRLVSDKGVDILLDALGMLGQEGLDPHLTLVGDGPEATRLQEQVRLLGLAERVEFRGTLTGENLVKALNRHRLLVVPSRYHEPFGIVALEGIACGCMVVGSSGGGLSEAIGPCGLTFRNGDATDLARILGDVLRHPERASEYLRHAGEHLALHSTKRVVAAYSRILSEAAGEKARRIAA
jgi:glycogen synthase